MKAILIINKMPERCGDCPLLQQWYDDEYEEWRDMCFWRYCKIEDTEMKLNVCPLKPMPEKMGNRLVVNDEEITSAYQSGFNDCIDEILGEEE